MSAGAEVRVDLRARTQRGRPVQIAPERGTDLAGETERRSRQTRP